MPCVPTKQEMMIAFGKNLEKFRGFKMALRITLRKMISRLILNQKIHHICRFTQLHQDGVMIVLVKIKFKTKGRWEIAKITSLASSKRSIKIENENKSESAQNDIKYSKNGKWKTC